MLYLVTGGSGSGKSEYAEKLAVDRHCRVFPGGNLYYIATMYPYDSECLKRIDKHQRMRGNKGFTTIECYHHLEQVEMEKQDVVLLECMSNLLANEMYLEQGRIKMNDFMYQRDIGFMEKETEKAILNPVRKLIQQAGCIVIVTNEVFSDGLKYNAETENYVKLLGGINTQLAVEAEGVVEVVCSIPVYRKGEVLC